MSTFQPPPTWALPVTVDEVTREAYFNPIWLKWFVDLSRELGAGGATSGTGTVTQVAALTLGTAGTGLSSTVVNGTTTPVITLNVPTASAANRGVLSPADWSTFNAKGAGTVTSVAAITLGTAGTDLSSTVAGSSTTPVITLQVPTASAANRGALSAADWSTFNAKQAALSPAALSRVDDTNVTMTLGGTPLTALLQAASMTLGWTGQLSVARGGTGGASSVYLDTPFTSQTSILVTHNFGKYPLVNILDNTGAVVLPLAIIHASLNAFTTTFSAPTTGNIIAATGF